MYWKPYVNQSNNRLEQFLVMVTYVALCMFLSVLLTPTTSLACASCGSGGSDPLILYPYENNKLFTSFGLQKIDREVSTDGRRGEVFGPTHKFSFLLSYGHRFHHNLFATVTSGLQFNRRNSHQGFGTIDPSFLARYTILNQTFEKPWYPQIQGLFGYKHATGTSIHDSKEKDLIDVTSSGFSDLKIGFDLWYGMFDIKGGLAYLRLHSLPRTEDDGSKNENGLTHRWTATCAYQISNVMKATTGLNRQTTEARRYQNRLVDQSETQDHSVFLNLDFSGYEDQTVRVSYVKTAILSSDRLTSQTQTLSTALLLAL